MSESKPSKTLGRPIPISLAFFPNDNDTVDVTLGWDYAQREILPDGFAIFWNRGEKDCYLTPSDNSVVTAPTSRSYTFHSLYIATPHNFGIAAIKGTEVGPIQQSTSSPDWTGVSGLAHLEEQLKGIEGNVGQIISHFGSLGKRLGKNLEHLVRNVVKEFAGKDFPFVENLTLRDDEGQLGQRNSKVEFDLYVHSNSLDETAYLIEIKSHLKPDEVSRFARKVKFAEKKLGRPVIPLILALSMKKSAKAQLEKEGIRYRVSSVNE